MALRDDVNAVTDIGWTTTNGDLTALLIDYWRGRGQDDLVAKVEADRTKWQHQTLGARLSEWPNWVRVGKGWPWTWMRVYVPDGPLTRRGADGYHPVDGRVSRSAVARDRGVRRARVRDVALPILWPLVKDCSLCGLPLQMKRFVHCDHGLPVSGPGGEVVAHNILLLHAGCNLAKSDGDLEEARDRLMAEWEADREGQYAPDLERARVAEQICRTVDVTQPDGAPFPPDWFGKA